MPAYSHTTANEYRARLDRIRALREQQAFYFASSTYNTNYWNTGYWGGGYWGGNYWGSGWYLNSYYCDPFDYLSLYNPYAFPYGYPSSASAFYLYAGSPCGFPSPYFSYSLFGGMNPYSGGYAFGYPFYSSLFYSAPFSPTVFGSFCPLCTTSNANFSLFALDNPYLLNPWPTTYSSSVGLNGGNGLSSSGAAMASSTENASLTPGLFGAGSANSGSSLALTASGAKALASPQPVSLVFTNGTTVQATKYWLGDGELHYVTTAGLSQSVPLAQLDMQATMKANRQNGVEFLPPSSGQASGKGQTR